MAGIPRSVVLSDFDGLDLRRDELTRKQNSFRVLENFDFQTPGSIQKTALLSRFGLVDMGSPFVEFRSYQRAPDEPTILIGITTNGYIVNLLSGEILATAPVVNFPFVCLLPGLTVDGGNVKTINYLVLTTGNGYPQKFDGSSLTQVGVSRPTEPATVAGVFVSATQGVQFHVGRLYTWTYWNPTTKHESSPAPVTDESNILLPIYQQDLTLYRNVEEVFVNVPTTPPSRGDGYTKKRVYATRDGGSIFYLLRALEGADEDGAVPLSQTYIRDGKIKEPSGDVSHVVKQRTPPVDLSLPWYNPWVSPNYDGSVPGTVAFFPPVGWGTFEGETPSTDLALSEPAPTEYENDPPPRANWGAVYQGRLWLIDKEQPTRLAFSKVGDFQSFPRDNNISFVSRDLDPVIGLYSMRSSLIVGKRYTLSRIVGTDFTDFVVMELESGIGFISKRLPIEMQGVLFFMSDRGLMALQGSNLVLVGDPIKPLTDTLSADDLAEKAVSAHDSERTQLYFGTHIGGGEHPLIVFDGSRFSRLDLGTRHIYAMREVRDPSTGEKMVLMGMDDGKVYRMFSGGHSATATAETQKMPLADLYSEKVFTVLRVEGDMTGFKYAYSVDGRGFGVDRQLRNYNNIGIPGKVLVVRIKHDSTFEGAGPKISNMRVDYVEAGEAR